MSADEFNITEAEFDAQFAAAQPARLVSARPASMFRECSISFDDNDDDEPALEVVRFVAANEDEDEW